MSGSEVLRALAAAIDEAGWAPASDDAAVTWGELRRVIEDAQRRLESAQPQSEVQWRPMSGGDWRDATVDPIPSGEPVEVRSRQLLEGLASEWADQLWVKGL